jgi:anti-sigma factor RsiW
VIEPERPITEEELHGYVDELIDGERRAAVERYLRAHPETAARIAIYEEQRGALRAMFAAAACGPTPPRLNLSRLVGDRLR